MKFRRAIAVVTAGVSLVVFDGCGGATNAPTPTGTVVTETYSGQTRATSPSGCGGDSHNLTMAEGAVSVTLAQTTGGAAMTVQVCAGGIDNNDCTINQTRIVVGQTLSGARKGGSVQNLKFLSAACVSGTPASSTPVDYSATITYSRIG